MKTLTNWSVAQDPRNPYLAPELRQQCLQGVREDGANVITSVIVGKTGLKESLQRAVVTKSGTRYLLKEIDRFVRSDLSQCPCASDGFS